MKSKQTKIKSSKTAIKKRPSVKAKTKCYSSCTQQKRQNKFSLWWETFKKYFKI